METLDLELETALAQVLLFLTTEEKLSFSLEELREMLRLCLSLGGNKARERFLAASLFMQGQWLLACSPLNKFFFQITHPEEALTLDGLVHQWTMHPSKEKGAARRYRERTLVV